MKILFYTTVFYPSIGGMEDAAEVLAKEFTRKGHKVTLVTKTEIDKNSKEKKWAFKVYRNINFIKYFKLVKRSDVVLHNCVSLKKLIPDLFFYKKMFVIHQTYYRINLNKQHLSFILKKYVSKLVKNIYISDALKTNLKIKGIVIPCAYDDKTFKIVDDIKKTKKIVFIGRLVSDKGCLSLLQSLQILKNEFNFKVNLNIIGFGPEEKRLKIFSDKELPGQVEFLGKLTKNELSYELNKYQIIVVPSLLEEPFGIVALSGIACGCLVIGSEKGGLKDAIGPCGWTFPNGDEKALAKLIFEVFNNKDAWAPKFRAVPDHLDKHKPEKVANAYLDFFQQHV